MNRKVQIQYHRSLVSLPAERTVGFERTAEKTAEVGGGDGRLCGGAEHAVILGAGKMEKEGIL